MTRFCHSAGRSIEREHLPPPILTRSRTEEIDACLRLARDAFEHLRGAGGVPVSHAVYLKLCSLSPPVLPVDVVMIDEAQDLNPCMLEIVEKQIQSGKQIILVGDTYQHIHDFTGAVDAMQYIARKYRPEIQGSQSAAPGGQLSFWRRNCRCGQPSPAPDGL